MLLFLALSFLSLTLIFCLCSVAPIYNAEGAEQGAQRRRAIAGPPGRAGDLGTLARGVGVFRVWRDKSRASEVGSPPRGPALARLGCERPPACAGMPGVELVTFARGVRVFRVWRDKARGSGVGSPSRGPALVWLGWARSPLARGGEGKVVAWMGSTQGGVTGSALSCLFPAPPASSAPCGPRRSRGSSRWSGCRTSISRAPG